MRAATFTYATKVEEYVIGAETLRVEKFASLDGTIDDYFREYEMSSNAELFESLCPYFGVLWPAGFELARYVEEKSAEWRNKKVFELGCGLGVPSLVLAKKGVSVTASDFHPDVPAFLAANEAHNGVKIPFVPLDWKSRGHSADIIVGSDLVYDHTQPQTLIDFLRGSVWAEVILTDPGRPYWDSFLALAKAEVNWRVEEFLLKGIFFVRILNVST